MNMILLFAISYLIGSIPTAYIYCRIKGKDITKHGSGNVGATNAGRLFGKKAFVTIFMLDALKGFIPLCFMIPFFVGDHPQKELITLITFFVILIGHVWSLYLKFKGGKGVATSLGGLLGILPVPTLASTLVFGIFFALTRTVSIGSLLAAVSLPLFTWIMTASTLYTITTIILAAFIIYTHRSNIERLLKGSENSFKKK